MKQTTAHLKDGPGFSKPWDRPTSATAGEAVKALLASEGWTFLLEGIQARLRFEQMQEMATAAGGAEKDLQHYDRLMGKWAGLRSIVALAESIVQHGENSEAEMRAA